MREIGMTTNAVFPLHLAMGPQKMLKFRHCVDTMKVRRRRTKAYLRLRFRAFTVGVAEYPTMFAPLAESRCGATQRSAMPDCRDKG